MKKNKWLPEIETYTLVGAEIQAGERRIYPVLKVFILSAGERLAGIKIDPVALLVVEDDMQYALSLEGEHMELEEIYRLAPSLNGIADEGTADEECI